MSGTWGRWYQQVRTKLGSYRYAAFIVLLGVILMLLPGGEEEKQSVHTSGEQEESFILEDFEAKLETILSAVEGAGKTRVMLTLDRGSRQILAQDLDRDSDGSGSSTTVTVGKGSGNQTVVPLQTMAPSFRGALIVCPGGNDPEVKWNLIAAVSALTGLGADCISICQGST